jgi:hypothetical protein
MVHARVEPERHRGRPLGRDPQQETVQQIAESVLLDAPEAEFLLSNHDA